MTHTGTVSVFFEIGTLITLFWVTESPYGSNSKEKIKDLGGVLGPHYFNADLDINPSFSFHADPDPDPAPHQMDANLRPLV